MSDLPDVLRPLSPEELKKLKPVSDEDLLRALEQGRKDKREAMRNRGSVVLPSIPFR